MIVEKSNDFKQLERFFSRIAIDINRFSIVNRISLLPAEVKETNGNILYFSTLTGTWKKLNEFHLFKENRKYYWIKKDVQLPEKKIKRSKYFLKFKCGDISEELLFINRKPCCGISTVILTRKIPKNWN